jgi:hypothetical protein
VAIDFWKIAMRPGKPFMYGRRKGQHVLGLPGNPVSALVCARLFLKPLIDALLGSAAGDDYGEARLGAAMLASSAAASMLTRDAGCACSSSASTSSTDSRRKDSPYEPQSRWIHFRRTAVALAAGGSRGGTPAPAQASTCHPNERPWTR